jgi:hypothetical protein
VIGLDQEETRAIVERLFPVTVERDLDISRIVEVFGLRAVTSSLFSTNGWTYDIDDTKRWAYFKGLRFRTEEDAAIATMFAAGVES